ncbi:MAG: RagB/SusD family nutrient uptake outer membrane protein [Mangrovibacterium sp.]
MKILKTIILESMLILGIAGCSDDYLNISPTDSVVTSTFYKTDNQMLEALTAAYSSLGNHYFYGNEYAVKRLLAEEGVGTSEAGMLDILDFVFRNTDSFIENIWGSCYQGIYRCNLVMQKAPLADQIRYPELLDRIVAEATVLRALYYWHIVTLWGDAPLRIVDNMDEKIIAKSDADIIWQFIEDDLTSVISSGNLPASYTGGNYETLTGGNEQGRITQGAAIALLGKVLLYRKNYTKAAGYFSQIIESSTYHYSLNTNLEDVWSVAGENTPEMVLEVMFSKTLGGTGATNTDGAGTSEGGYRNIFIGPGQFGAWDNVYPTQTIVDEFEPGDPRLDAFIWSDGDVVNGYGIYDPDLNKGDYSIKKGMGANFTDFVSGGFDENTPLIRYADVLLMYAECLANGATGSKTASYYVDIVRKRAFGANFKSVETLMAEKGWDIMTAIKHERAVELCFEYHRFNDLVRWGDALVNNDYESRGISSKGLYLPIPQYDIDNSNGVLIQNSDY